MRGRGWAVRAWPCLAAADRCASERHGFGKKAGNGRSSGTLKKLRGRHGLCRLPLLRCGRGRHVLFDSPQNGVTAHFGRAVHPCSRLDEQLLLLSAQNAHPYHLQQKQDYSIADRHQLVNLLIELRLRISQPAQPQQEPGLTCSVANYSADEKK